MVTAQFSKVCTGDLKNSIQSLAEGFAKNPAIQEDLYYTAWIAIAKAHGDYTPEYYYYCAYISMLKKYDLIYRPVADIGKNNKADMVLKAVRKKRRFYRRRG